jgi:hypothetical protein
MDQGSFDNGGNGVFGMDEILDFRFSIFFVNINSRIMNRLKTIISIKIIHSQNESGKQATVYPFTSLVPQAWQKRASDVCALPHLGHTLGKSTGKAAPQAWHCSASGGLAVWQ